MKTLELNLSTGDLYEGGILVKQMKRFYWELYKYGAYPSDGHNYKPINYGHIEAISMLSAKRLATRSIIPEDTRDMDWHDLAEKGKYAKTSLNHRFQLWHIGDGYRGGKRHWYSLKREAMIGRVTTLKQVLLESPLDPLFCIYATKPFTFESEAEINHLEYSAIPDRYYFGNCSEIMRLWCVDQKSPEQIFEILKERREIHDKSSSSD